MKRCLTAAAASRNGIFGPIRYPISSSSSPAPLFNHQQQQLYYHSITTANHHNATTTHKKPSHASRNNNKKRKFSKIMESITLKHDENFHSRRHTAKSARELRLKTFSSQFSVYALPKDPYAVLLESPLLRRHSLKASDGHSGTLKRHHIKKKLTFTDLMPMRAYFRAKKLAQLGQPDAVLEIYDALNASLAPHNRSLSSQQKQLFLRLVFLSHICCEHNVTLREEAWKMLIMCIGTQRDIAEELYREFELPQSVRDTLLEQNWMQRLGLSDMERLPLDSSMVNALLLLSFETASSVIEPKRIMAWADAHDVEYSHAIAEYIIMMNEQVVKYRLMFLVPLSLFCVGVLCWLYVRQWNSMQTSWKEVRMKQELDKYKKQLNPASWNE